MTDAARATSALLGAYVADAAAMGLHWLYDPARIAALEGPIAFRAPDAADFEGAMGVFVHHGKRSGDLSHYGQQMRAMVQALAQNGGAFEVSAYQARFAALFGPGGLWSGYIDRPTRGALIRIAEGVEGPTGIEDDQLPAIAKLPPLLVRPDGATEDELTAAVTVTNLGEPAMAWARAFAAMLAAALAGEGLSGALAAGRAAPDVGEAMAAAERSPLSPVDFAGEVGRACHLPQGLPVIARLFAWAEAEGAGAEEIVVENVRIGGDSCGRAIALGALVGAASGFGAPRGLPPLWAARLVEGPALAAEIDAALGGGNGA